VPCDLDGLRQPALAPNVRELATDLFRRETIDPKMTRGEALRQAMVALMVDDGDKDPNGKLVFTWRNDPGAGAAVVRMIFPCGDDAPDGTLGVGT
jgi:hypothetical protein